MDNNLDIQIDKALKAYRASGIVDQVDYQKFYQYSIVTHSTAIEGSTVTEIENPLPKEQPETSKILAILQGRVQTKPVDGLFVNNSYERV